MRYLWIDRGAGIRYDAFPKHGINGLFFDLLDQRLDKPFLQDVRSKGYAVGVYAAASTNPAWLPLWDESGARHAEKVSERLEQIAPRTGASFPKVQFDIELHLPGYILDCLRRWRELRPTRDTSWTMEPFQAGWMTDELVQSVVNLGVRVVPQYYLGPSPQEPWDMRPAAQDIAKGLLVERGFPRQLVTGFYDAKTLPAWWDGFAFIQHRLP